MAREHRFGGRRGRSRAIWSVKHVLGGAVSPYEKQIYNYINAMTCYQQIRLTIHLRQRMHPLPLINPHRPRSKPQHSNQPHSHPSDQHAKINSKMAFRAEYNRAGTLDLMPISIPIFTPPKTMYLQNCKKEDRNRRDRSVA